MIRKHCRVHTPRVIQLVQHQRMNFVGVLMARLMAGVDECAFLFGEAQVCVDHHVDEFGEPDGRSPAELVVGLGRVALQQIHFGRAKIARVE